MTPEQFAAELAREGFEPAVTVTREAGGMLGDHTHPFDAKALILAGEIGITVAGVEQVYRAGEMFQLPAATQHSECYGAEGVTYLAGRRHPA